MSVTPPLLATEFWTKIRFAHRPEFQLTEYKRQSMDSGSRFMGAKLAEPNWRCTVATTGGWHDADIEVQALIKLLRARDAALLAFDIRRPFPKLDPRGDRIAGYAPKVKTVGSNNRSLSLKDVRHGYDLSTGDRISVRDDDGRRVLLELMEPVNANGSGDTAEFEVQPYLPVWISANMAVDISRPLAKFKLLPGSYQPQAGQGNTSSGITFSMVSIIT